MTQNMHRFIAITGKKWEHNKQLYTQQSSKVLVHLQELDMHHRKATEIRRVVEEWARAPES